MGLPEYLASGEFARLIPVAADSNKEARAASILLATLSAVPPFQSVMLSSLNQRIGIRSNLDCYTEIVFKGDDKNKSRPDGLMVLDGRGGRIWTCLIEAKIKNEIIDQEQIERYLNLAKQNNIDAVLTISNQFVAMPTHSPLHLPKSALKNIELYHWSWMYTLTNALLLLETETFERPEQKFILAEMTRYFSHPTIGISSFDRMNSEWKDVVIKIQSGAILNKNDVAVENTIGAWHQESKDICLLMSRKLNRPVNIKLSKAHLANPIQRVQDDCENLANNNRLECVIDIPDTASPILIIADLLRRTVSVSMSLVAPKDKQKSSSRINWLLKQISKTNSDKIHIKSVWPGRAQDLQAPLVSVRDNPAILEHENKTLSPTGFEVMLVRDLAGKFSGAKTFIEYLESAVPLFYEQVGQYLRAYIAPPPRIKNDPDENEPTENISKEAENLSAESIDIIQGPDPKENFRSNLDPIPPIEEPV